MFAPNTRTTTATVKISSPPTAFLLTVITITQKIRRIGSACRCAGGISGVSFAIHYSRFNNREKNGKPARPKFHVLFSIDRMTDATLYSDMKSWSIPSSRILIRRLWMLLGSFSVFWEPNVKLYPGRMNLTKFLVTTSSMQAFPVGMKRRSYPGRQSNVVVSRFAGIVIKIR